VVGVAEVVAGEPAEIVPSLAGLRRLAPGQVARLRPGHLQLLPLHHRLQLLPGQHLPLVLHPQQAIRLQFGQVHLARLQSRSQIFCERTPTRRRRRCPRTPWRLQAQSLPLRPLPLLPLSHRLL